MKTATIRLIVALVGLIASIWSTLADSQSGSSVPTIGVLIVPSASNARAYVGGLERGLRDLGYIEGHNIVIERRYADGQVERLSKLAVELVRLNTRVLFDPTVIAGAGGQGDRVMDRRRFLLTSLAGAFAAPLAETFSGSCQAIVP